MEAKEQETRWENFALHAPGSNQILSLNGEKKKAHLAKSSLYVYKSYKQKGILKNTHKAKNEGLFQSTFLCFISCNCYKTQG